MQPGVRDGTPRAVCAPTMPMPHTRGSCDPMTMDATLTIDAAPYSFGFCPEECALLIIDMQRDFLEPGGFGEMLGNDVGQLRRTIEPNRTLLSAWRAHGLQVLHTREGHRPDLSDLPPAKK